MIDHRSKEDFLDWLYGLSAHGIKLGLKSITELLRRLGDPQDSFSSVHVAGTDGKGSICATISSILIESGVTTGLFVSPHLVSFNERISVNGSLISDDDLAAAAAVTVPHVTAMAEEGMRCTFFEVTTAIAFMYFKKKGVEYAVVEVGLGGRFDATNVLIPEVCVISNISTEHTEYLGDTVEEIAFEKAGIIKPCVPCVTLNQDLAFSIIEKVAEENGSPLTCVDPRDIEVLSLFEDHTDFTYKEEGYSISIPGSCQAKNAVLAIEAVSNLKIYGHKCRCRVKSGLNKVNWPCRIQRIPDTPFIIDVTHTAAGSVCLCSDIMEIYGNVTLVFGILGGKDIDHITGNLSEIANNIIITQPDTDRAVPSAKVAEHMSAFKKVDKVTDNLEDAMEAALDLAGDDLILVTGSFYIAGNALKWLERKYPGSSTDCLRRIRTTEPSLADRRKA
ncbi:MAG TPA: folylpolyglutamate synthase/dihydrofolate synthase family protein [Candidatus Methanomethylophilaceae archaeon]|nr:folylpolyglutamate synthase/dihydrofolate synthase family protein [Candidatus Methanomethylophilaceae archaeon]